MIYSYFLKLRYFRSLLDIDVLVYKSAFISMQNEPWVHDGGQVCYYTYVKMFYLNVCGWFYFHPHEAHSRTSRHSEDIIFTRVLIAWNQVWQRIWQALWYIQKGFCGSLIESSKTSMLLHLFRLINYWGYCSWSSMNWIIFCKNRINLVERSPYLKRELSCF